jgi:hypothetical protein
MLEPYIYQAVNKGQLDAGLALKPNSTSVTNEINARITNEFTALVLSLAWLIGRK